MIRRQIFIKVSNRHHKCCDYCRLYTIYSKKTHAITSKVLKNDMTNVRLFLQRLRKPDQLLSYTEVFCPLNCGDGQKIEIESHYCICMILTFILFHWLWPSISSRKSIARNMCSPWVLFSSPVNRLVKSFFCINFVVHCGCRMPTGVDIW